MDASLLNATPNLCCLNVVAPVNASLLLILCWLSVGCVDVLFWSWVHRPWMRCGRERLVQNAVVCAGGSEQWASTGPADFDVCSCCVSTNLYSLFINTTLFRWSQSWRHVQLLVPRRLMWRMMWIHPLYVQRALPFATRHSWFSIVGCLYVVCRTNIALSGRRV